MVIPVNRHVSDLTCCVLLPVVVVDLSLIPIQSVRHVQTRSAHDVIIDRMTAVLLHSEVLLDLVDAIQYVVVPRLQTDAALPEQLCDRATHSALVASMATEQTWISKYTASTVTVVSLASVLDKAGLL